MSCVWQEGNLMSPGTSFFCFSLIPHQCLAIGGTVLVLDTFCSSRISKKAHCTHHIFVSTGSAVFHRFSFHTNYASMYIESTIHLLCLLCTFVCQLGSGWGDICSEFMVVSCTGLWLGFVGIARFISALVFVAANIISERRVAFYCATSHK